MFQCYMKDNKYS